MSKSFDSRREPASQLYDSVLSESEKLVRRMRRDARDFDSEDLAQETTSRLILMVTRGAIARAERRMNAGTNDRIRNFWVSTTQKALSRSCSEREANSSLVGRILCVSSCGLHI